MIKFHPIYGRFWRRSKVSLECVPLSAYCQMTGETPEAINKRVQRGIWREGIHVLKIAGVKERWIDLHEIDKWARGGRVN
ncbi:excisionase [Rahnella laticis]|uniref:excisionase n=1 Tax=Rahnella laticis TaxID=2787622 RepID=UPI001E62C716|nr:excisionase [Rahnella laticis]